MQFETKMEILKDISMADEDRKILAAGGLSRRRYDLENIYTPGWKPGWSVQLRINPRDGMLETVCSPTARQFCREGV